MKLKPIQITPPASDQEIVTLDFVKKHAAYESSDADDLIRVYIAEAIRRLDGPEGLLGGRCFLTQTWKQQFSTWCHRMPLPLFPVTAVNSVKYYAEDAAVLSTLASTNYRLQQGAAEAYVEYDDTISWPTLDTRDDAIEIEFAVGDGNAAAVLPQFKLAIARIVAYWIDKREIDSMPPGWNEPMGQFRRWPV